MLTDCSDVYDIKVQILGTDYNQGIMDKILETCITIISYLSEHYYKLKLSVLDIVGSNLLQK